jgi:hypothetical protein
LISFSTSFKEERVNSNYIAQERIRRLKKIDDFIKEDFKIKKIILFNNKFNNQISSLNKVDT